MEELRALFVLDTDSGVLFWRERPCDWFKTKRDCRAWNTRLAGKPAGTPDNKGYIQVKLKDGLYFAHRIVYAMASGGDPFPLQVDHINGAGADNRPSNLRAVGGSVNRVNGRARGPWPKGVYRPRPGGKFVAQTKPPGGTTIYLGTFDSPGRAHQAYLEAVSELYGKGTYCRG